jgi:nicotinate-nucleotide adenylyltransferase
MMKIGMYGGSFDPPHNAHLYLADWVQKELGLDLIYFIPAAIHAFKNNSDLSPPLLRLKLVEQAIKKYKKFRISRIEIEQPETSYTVFTLQNFKRYEGLPDCDLYYIMGYDNLVDFHKWKDPEIILDLAKIVVIGRSIEENRDVNTDIAGRVLYLESPLIDLSSTDIREKIKSGMDVSDLVPSPVLSIINDHGLYRDQNKD